jgi:type 1 glutamine amidotransferase
MRILVFCGDHWHPARVPREGLGELTNAGFEFDWIEDARAWSPESLAAYPLVILAKSNNVSSADESPWMTDAVQSAFAGYVRAGNGLLVLHSGTAGYDQAPVLRRLLGGVFLRHPEQCPVTLDPKPDHPLCAGCAPFTLKDEHYLMEMEDPAPEVFATTRSEHGEQPGAWRRKEGAGRVAVLTPGHNLEVWLHPSFQNLLLNLMRWCGEVS